MSRMPGEVNAESLLPLLSGADITVRGEAALALARHQPRVALNAIPARLLVEVKIARVQYDDYVKRRQAETDGTGNSQLLGTSVAR